MKAEPKHLDAGLNMGQSIWQLPSLVGCFEHDGSFAIVSSLASIVRA
jgi:hypothetical protein